MRVSHIYTAAAKQTLGGKSVKCADGRVQRLQLRVADSPFLFFSFFFVAPVGLDMSTEEKKSGSLYDCFAREACAVKKASGKKSDGIDRMIDVGNIWLCVYTRCGL